MRILFMSPVFAPSKGGVETVTAQVASGLSGAGFDVAVATDAPGGDDGEFPFAVYRKPSTVELRKLIRRADIVWHQQPCLRMLLRAGLFPKRMGATFHTWFGAGGAGVFLRRSAIGRFGARYGVSEAVSASLPNPSGVLPNSYDPSVFHPVASMARPHWNVGCVARLVSDKGVDLLIEALGNLRSSGLEISCAIVGEGPEKARLEDQAKRLKLGDSVKFLPFLAPQELAEFYRQCAVCVVPSRWEEPFGLTALEAIASGTPVIASGHGGLPEAVGPCGLFFRPSDVVDLAAKIRQFLEDEEKLKARLLLDRESHLTRYHPDVQRDAYLSAFDRL